MDGPGPTLAEAEARDASDPLRPFRDRRVLAAGTQRHPVTALAEHPDADPVDRQRLRTGPDQPHRQQLRTALDRRLARVERLLPPFYHESQVIRVMNRLPVPPFRLPGSGAGELVPALVIPENCTIGVGDPA